MRHKQQETNNYTEFYYHFFRNILLVGIPLVIISALIFGFSVSHSSATNSGSDSVTLTLSTSCTLSSSIITPHHASLNGGQYEEGIGDTRINTYCNDNNGYSIYAIGTSNNVDGNTDLVSNLDEHYNIHTGAYANGDNIDTSTPSFWGMKLIPGIGTGSSSELTPPTIMNSYNSYNVVPSSYTLVASRTSGTNMTIDTNITGSYFNTTYNIYATSVQPAGSYEGRVKYVMIHPSSNNNHLGFNEVYTLQGKNPVNTENGTYYTMQDMTTDICNMVNVYDESSQTQLVDIRDNKIYWVAKLQDGHCWMTQNLDLDLSHSIALTSETTDLNDNSLAGAYNLHYSYDPNTRIISWTPENTTANYSTGAGAWVTSRIKASSMDTGEWYWDGDDNTTECDYLTTACGHFSQTMTTTNKHFHVGNFYNWSAAIASDDSGSLTSSTFNDIGNNPKNSICPKGWRLPTISSQESGAENSTDEFSRLNLLYNTSSNKVDSGLIIGPLWLTRSGYRHFSSSTITDGGSVGQYWSSTNQGNSNAYKLGFSHNNVSPKSASSTLYGYSIRCLAR